MIQALGPVVEQLRKTGSPARFVGDGRISDEEDFGFFQRGFLGRAGRRGKKETEKCQTDGAWPESESHCKRS
jgi:hypothetical protein